MRRLPDSAGRVLLAVVVAAGALIGATGAAHAIFAHTAPSTATTISTKRLFPSSHTVAASTVRDLSGGPDLNASEPLSAAADGRTAASGAWGVSFSASRFYDVDFPDVLPDGLAVTTATLALRFASVSGTTCVYLEVRSRSTGAVLGTKGSAVTPLRCAGTAVTTVSIQLPELATTAAADDLRLRVFGRNTASAAATFDQATVDGATPFGPFTLLPVRTTNQATGTPTVTNWSLAGAADGSSFLSAGQWKPNYDVTRSLRLTFPAVVPTDATVTAATFTHAARDVDAVSACYYFEVLAGATLLGTHGSPAAPYCANGGAFVTETVALPEVTTAAAANSLTVRLFVSNGSGDKRSEHDLATLTVRYHVD